MILENNKMEESYSSYLLQQGRQSPHLTLCHNQIQKRLSQQLSIVTFTRL